MGEKYKPKILIIDDEKGIRDGTKRLLESEGYSADTASNGEEGIYAGTTVEYDAAIIDLKMPGIDGIAVLKAILKSRPNTVCIIATGYASYETAVESTSYGAFGYIPKPFTSDELLQKINQAVYKRQLLLESEKWKKEREERLLEVAFEKTRLNTIINSISDGLLVVNKEGQAVLFNPSALKFLGVENILIEEQVIDRLPEGISSLIYKFLRSGKYEKTTYSARLEPSNTTDLFIEAAASAVPHHDGSLAGVVVVLKDITEMKKLEQLKSQFVSMVSHELKAPVAAVYGYLQLLDNSSISLTEEQKKNYLKRSQLRLDSVLKMVNDLLDISRMEMKTITREIKEIQLGSVVRNVIEFLSLEINKQNLNLKLELDEPIPTVNADMEEITRLFINLLSNAVKYNKPGGSIEINIFSSGGFAAARIKDTGIGLMPEEKEKIFHEFFRAKNEMTKDISGTGLGLSIVKRIVDSYAGKVEVESEFGKGTAFTVYLPVNTEAGISIKEKEILTDNN